MSQLALWHTAALIDDYYHKKWCHLFLLLENSKVKF
jgi:hypothetical protein